MGWLSKKLKKVTKVLDPVGDKLRKSTGGSYGDPMNWYQSKPNQTIPYQQRTSPGLIPAPQGAPPPGMTFGGNTGGRNYIQNQFANSGGMMMGGVQPQPTPMAPRPSIPSMGPPNVSTPTQPPPQQAQMSGPMQQQMMRIGAIRGSNV